MYERHFGFAIKPFALTPDPAFLYPSRQHAMALTMLEYGLESQAAFCLLTGDIGSGKTTLVRKLLRQLGDHVAVGLISNTHNRFNSIHRWALSALEIAPSDESDIAIYEALVDSFVREYAKGRRTLLIFDEAQNLSIDALEELRLLSNVNSEKDLVLQILLVALLFVGLGMAHPHIEGAGFLLAAVPFLFIFVSGVLADLLETRRRPLVMACVVGMIAAYVIWSVVNLEQVPQG